MGLIKLFVVSFIALLHISVGRRAACIELYYARTFAEGTHAANCSYQ